MARAALALAGAILLLSAVSAVRLGGLERATPSEEHIQEVARYAVNEIAQQSEYGGLSLDRILTARKQIVAGAIYFLTLEAVESSPDKSHTFEVAVYEPFGAYTNTLKLTHFKEANAQASSNRPQASGADQPVEAGDLLDSVAAEAAASAVMQLTQQSNSLYPWTLRKVVSAKQVSAAHGEGAVYQLTFAAARAEEEKVFQVNMRLLDADEWMVSGAFVPVLDAATQ